MAKKIDISKKKKELLQKLKSPSKSDGYKRYSGTPLRYAGGKTLAVGHIVNLLPDKIGKVVSPFLGGASVEIALAKELGIEVIGYDIFDILINYWHYQITQPKELAKKIAEKVTDYGFNDEYGYYSDWLDGVFPIIKSGIDQILKEEKDRILNDIKTRVESGMVEINFIEKIIKE